MMLASTVGLLSQRSEKKFTVEFKQKYQQFDGTAQVDGKTVPVINGRLRGKEIMFDIQMNGQQGTFRGEVESKARGIEGHGAQFGLAL